MKDAKRGSAAQPWTLAPVPAWVDSVVIPMEPGAGAGGREDLLVDLQQDHRSRKSASFVRWAGRATEASALGQVAQVHIPYQPAYQKVRVHEAYVLRDGQQLDRRDTMRVETMRRESRLESQVIDGVETLLVLLADVRLGDVVVVSHSVEGQNPIYEGRLAERLQLAFDQPVRRLRHRVLVEANRPLTVTALGTELRPTDAVSGQTRSLTLQLDGVAAMPQEQQVPPWIRRYPVLHLSDYASWAEVDDWAQRLFAGPAEAPDTAEMAAQIDRLRASGLGGTDLIDLALTFVQDEVRYFSVSLGESSHRPKPPAQTLRDRVGDCKDKVALLNALLSALGFEARPALVSTRRLKGLVDLPPGHDAFDHAVSAVTVDGKTMLLDATLSDQGTTFATRGQMEVGAALIVGRREGPRLVAVPASAVDEVAFHQDWDVSKPGQPAQLKVRVVAAGLSAEYWRRGLAMAGHERVFESLGSAYERILPGLSRQGGLKVVDDRGRNRIELSLSFEKSAPARYERGAVQVESGAIELIDFLGEPQEVGRQSPFHRPMPALATSVISFKPPVPMPVRPPHRAEVRDARFDYTLSASQAPQGVRFERSLRRLGDEVPVSDLSGYREHVRKVRSLLGAEARLPLVDLKLLLPRLETLAHEHRRREGFADDALDNLLGRNDAERLIATMALDTVPEPVPLRAAILSARAVAANLLGDFGQGLADADAALAIEPASRDALDARGVALVGLGRLDEALRAFDGLLSTDQALAAMKWQGAIHLTEGRAAQARDLLQQVVDRDSGDNRDFALLWLYLAAEQATPGEGRSSIEAHVDAADPKRLAGALLHHFAGRLSRGAVLGIAEGTPHMKRLNLAEAYFYIGRHLVSAGQPEDAVEWFDKAVATGATPYREVTFARQELARRGSR